MFRNDELRSLMVYSRTKAALIVWELLKYRWSIPQSFCQRFADHQLKNSWIIHIKSNPVSTDENFCCNTSNRVLSRHGYDEGGTKIHVFHASRDDHSKVLAEKFKMCVKYYRERERERERERDCILFKLFHIRLGLLSRIQLCLGLKKLNYWNLWKIFHIY